MLPLLSALWRTMAKAFDVPRRKKVTGSGSNGAAENNFARSTSFNI